MVYPYCNSLDFIKYAKVRIICNEIDNKSSYDSSRI